MIALEYNIKLSKKELYDLKNLFDDENFSVRKLPFFEKYYVKYHDGNKKVKFMKFSKDSISIYESEFETIPDDVREIVTNKIGELNFINDEINGLDELIKVLFEI